MEIKYRRRGSDFDRIMSVEDFVDDCFDLEYSRHYDNPNKVMIERLRGGMSRLCGILADRGILSIEDIEDITRFDGTISEVDDENSLDI